MVKITGECPASWRGQFVVGARNAAFKTLGTRDVSGFFEFAGVHAEIAIRRIQKILEFGEGERFIDGESAEDSHAQPFVNKSVYIGGFANRLQDWFLLAQFARHI